MKLSIAEDIIFDEAMYYLKNNTSLFGKGLPIGGSSKVILML
jgi:hypothetical protein